MASAAAAELASATKGSKIDDLKAAIKQAQAAGLGYSELSAAESRLQQLKQQEEEEQKRRDAAAALQAASNISGSEIKTLTPCQGGSWLGV